jgi:hypothetical protein
VRACVAYVSGVGVHRDPRWQAVKVLRCQRDALAAASEEISTAVTQIAELERQESGESLVTHPCK